MNDHMQSWARLLKEDGPHFLNWIQSNDVLGRKLENLAVALNWLFRLEIKSKDDAIAVSKAVPAAYKNLDCQSVYDDIWPAISFTGLHLLDRYVRTWIALEHLVRMGCFPMGNLGVNVLDVGSGPGPSAIAIHDFYEATIQYSNQSGQTKWRQPAHISCVEKGRSVNHLRHMICECLYELSLRNAASIFALCRFIPDFKHVLPAQQRRQLQHELNQSNELTDDEWLLTPFPQITHRGNMTDPLHTYRFIFLSYILTDADMFCTFKPNLTEIFYDSMPGATIAILGGEGEKHREVYQKVTRLAVSSGFRVEVKGETISWANSEFESRIREEGIRFFHYLRHLAPDNYQDTREVQSYFQGSAPCSQLWVFRKYAPKRKQKRKAVPPTP
ncbi:MAG: hypothetical protein OXO50_08165 [Caldilineaceae bacterium]|nr:hypothetical protein [Caldilineaceae bacterium]